MRGFTILILLAGVIGCQGKSAEETAKSESAAKQTAAKNAEVPEPMALPFKPLAPPTQAEIDAGWIELFDGKTLFGWEADDAGKPDAVNWAVKDGAITADAGGIGLLMTYVPFADYEFRCEYRLAKDGNSGLFLRTIPNPKDPAVDCYELNLCEDNPFPTGSLVKRDKVPQPLLRDNQWVLVHVTVQGPRIQARFGGEQVLDFTDKSKHVRLSGRIGLQKNAGKIEFRSIALKPLGTKPLFNGKDLAGWHQVPGSKSDFEVDNGTIHVKNGLGFLETDHTWADFVLQAQAICKTAGANSGIFFRGLPGEKEQSINGYELQVQNSPNPKETKKYLGDRTGGIFRLAAPRKVVSKDHEWFNLTLVAAGPRLATWVNGYPVVAWEDDRKPNENPRRGKRLKAGHISLQGHDETTDVEYRDLKITAPAKTED